MITNKLYCLFAISRVHLILSAQAHTSTI